MKNYLSLAILSLAMISCTTPSKKKDTSEVRVEKEEKLIEADQSRFVPIEGEDAILQTALMAAPKESRDSCKVLAYNENGEVITLREGTNQFIVLVDDPKKAGFSAACYHISLEPFMARGRELKAEGKGREEIFNIRGEEIKSGKLKMGNPGSTLHIYYGSEEDYNPATGEVKDAKYRYVVYLPYATSETTGLPIQPVFPNHPWIMDPGTHRAHIMITPKENKDRD